MNYAQITISGERLGLRFGMLATQLFYEAAEQGKRVIVGDTVTDLGIAYILWFGYLNNCEVKQVDPARTFEEFYDRVSDIDETDDEVGKALECWASSKVVRKAVEESKKKMTSILSSLPSSPASASRSTTTSVSETSSDISAHGSEPGSGLLSTREPSAGI